MKIIRESSEAEMILEFLKGELTSQRFGNQVNKTLEELSLKPSIIINGNHFDKQENINRLNIMKKVRGYPDKELFNNFPKIEKWQYMQLEENDINNIYYIDYDYWNELSNGTSKPIEAAKTIKSGKEIYGVSNKPFLEGAKYNKNNSFPPVILITCNDKKFLIIEGHSRMTIYGLNPSKIDGTYAFVGYTKEEEMKRYDKRMLINEKTHD